ncbi:hypothetical protein KI688_007691 [Linnemannia hyalina]|uniref:Arm-like repeat domain-containing protein n=1 Tax=Linnemannia hyalina TaxID=64524 RepID=A0A9P8BPM8_9FUNG|nr:hypothetical protein KI688_007691 [Linnemannia hyalina]
MTDHATSTSCPDRAKITPEGRLTLNRLNVCAKKAIEPCAKADRTLSNAIAAIHLENSKIMSPVFVHPNKQAPHRNGSVLGSSLVTAPARQITARCVDQKTPIQSTRRSLLPSSQSNDSQTIDSSSNDAGFTNFLLLPKSATPSSVTHQPSSRPSLASFSQTSSTRTTVPPSDATGLTNFLLLSTAVAPSPSVVQKPPPIHKVFPNNIAKPELRSWLPDLAFHFKSTRQLAFGLLLLTQDPTSSSPPIATQDKAQGLVLTDGEMVWVTNMRVATKEHDSLRWLAAQVVTQFLKKQHKDAGSIEEVTLLGAVLERKDYRGVLSALIGQLEREKLTDVDLLQALVQFLQSAPPKHLVDDDFVRILRVLRGRLKDTHKALNDKRQPGSDHVYHLSTAIARILDAMIAGKIHGLDRAEDHLPLLDLLVELKESVDPYLKFQATYAWQALQYVGDDETPLHAVLRFGGGVTKAALGVASVFKLDPEHLFNGLYELGLAAGQVYDVVKAGVEGAQAFRTGGEGVVDSMLKGFRSGAKKAWYPALQGARVFVREGRLADFERVIYEAPCCREPEFQMGVCQLLGELAVDPIWELKTRQQAVNLLRQLYTSDPTWVVDTGVKVGILGILLCLSMTEDNTIQLQSAVIFEDLAHDRVGAPPGPYPLAFRLPIPTASPLLDKTLKIQSIERNLLQMKTLRLAHHDKTIYIPPLAKANPQTPEEEATPLMDQVTEFLDSERQVFLVIGDSGSGKSTFNLHLEHSLWKAYEQGDPRIPLYIHLPTLRSLTSMIDEQLMKYHFDMSTIQELKLTGREFIVICDGYDEARLITNLHSGNGWNRPFGWNTKMIVSCRSTHLGREYHTRFQPMPSSPYHAPLLHLFQEAVIVPFSQGQVKEYVEQFVQDPTMHGLFCRKEVQWSAEKYLDMIERIPNLAELVRNPFLLTLALRALPDVVMNGGEGGADSTTTDETVTADVAEMTRSQLYKSFVSQWLDINKRRLTTSLTLQCPTAADTPTTTTPTAASTLQDLIDEGFQEIALDFLQSLAAAIYKYQRGKPIVEYWHRSDKTTWKADFFGPELDITLLRESSPLTKVENFHFFIHRSLMEYFYSCHLARTTRPRYGFKKPGPAVALPTMFAHENFSSSATLNSYYDISEDISRSWLNRHYATQWEEDALLEYNPSPFQHQSQPHPPHPYPSEPLFQPPPMQYEQQYEQHYPFYAVPDSYQHYPSVIGGSRLEKLQHTKSKSELESEAGPCFDDGLMENVDLEEEPEILQFLVERAREDEKYRGMLRGYVGVDVTKLATPKALRNAKRILELVDV